MYQYSKRNADNETRKKFIFSAIVAVLPFLYFAIIGFSDWTNVTAQDYKVGAFFYDLRTPMRTVIAIGITRLGDIETQTIVTVAITLLLFIFKKWRTGLWYGLTVLIGALLINGFVKEIYQRVRPDQIEHLVEQGGYSFPSGHAMGSVIVYGGLIFLGVRLFKSNIVKWTIGIILGSLILLIGLSRIYVGVHYPSDVIGGFSLGFAWLAISIALLGLKITHDESRPKNRYSFKNYSR